MKMQVFGLEASSGISGKTGKEYAMASIHAVARLAPPLGTGNIAQGSMGTAYRCTPEIVKRVAHLPLPFWAEVDVQDVMRFGKREQEVMDCVPLVDQPKLVK